MNDATGQVSAGLVELLRHVSEKHEDCDICAALHANPFAIALDAYVADECRRAVAAVGCESLRWQDMTCAEIIAEERAMEAAGHVKVLEPHELCAPCQKKAEIDAEVQDAAKG